MLRPLLTSAPPDTPLHTIFAGRTGPLDLGETIEIWRLDGPEIAGARTIEDAAVRIGRWHHQIVMGGKAVAHATSVELDALGEPPRIASLVHSPALAVQIEAAMEMADRDSRLDDAVEARLLAVPSYHLTTLWLVGPRISGIAVLPGVTTDRAEERIDVSELFLMGEENFLYRLRRAGAIGGFVNDPELY